MTEIIFSYTRAQAIADGVLVDVSELAKEAGFRFPVALTSAVWGACVEVGPTDNCQDEQARLWDILNVLRYRSRETGSQQVIRFEVLIANGGSVTKPVLLKAHCGPGDYLEPVITIMLPGED